MTPTPPAATALTAEQIEQVADDIVGRLLRRHVITHEDQSLKAIPIVRGALAALSAAPPAASAETAPKPSARVTIGGGNGKSIEFALCDDLDTGKRVMSVTADDGGVVAEIDITLAAARELGAWLAALGAQEVQS